MVRLIALLISLALGSPAVAEQFSIKCAQEDWYHFTFDTETSRIVFESASGMALKGKIAAASKDEIRFDLVKIASPKFDLIWQRRDRGESTLTWVGVPNNPERQTVNMTCIRTELRPVLSFYDQIAPMK
jgi:hypothetical protein